MTLTLLINTMGFATACVTLLPALVFAGQCLLGVAASRRSSVWRVGPHRDAVASTRFAYLLPAHDEEQVIGDTLAAIFAQVEPGDEVVVVADNCSDATAEVARRSGASVVERTDLQRRGKGWALAAGRDYLKQQPPDVLVIVDADTLIGAGFARSLRACPQLRERPVQSTYVVSAADGDEVAGISALAFAVRNAVRPLGLRALGLPCLLNGSGMAIPWAIAVDAPLAGGHIGEEYRLSIDLVLEGHPTVYWPSAMVAGPLPTSDEVSAGQRRRWTHTSLTVMRDQIPRLLWGGLRRGEVAPLALAADLLVPPLTLLLLAHLAALVVTALLALVGGSFVPVMLVLTGLALVVSSVAAAATLFKFPAARRVQAAALTRYLRRHLAHGVEFFYRPHTHWNKTAREVVKD
ncbi:N-glycosyltransferase [Posidoniimonas polymericola]|uniref:N-glycosyltransferase n=1 Tax=Posidoniimonas polymericola TaxID=2528002 RepID=A0A5C5ZFV5_9BACT|nr:glycosyltransferase family 2 protein [Posidoniimonas polymericola]TWT85917.1 N-glycosyltransferase [Posidoniimonas polymericola]